MRLKEFKDLPLAQQRSFVQKVKKAVRTRWLSLDAGVEAVYKEYTYLLHALRLMRDESGESTGATAAGVLKKVDDMKFLAVLYVLKLLLPYLSILRKTFQSGELNFSRIKPAIEKTIHRIKDLAEKQKPLPELKQDLASRHILCEKELLAENEQQVKLHTEKYAESINVNACFPEDMLSVLGSFSIFNVENFPPSSDSEELKVYGDENIHILKDHYQDDENTARNQWNDFPFEMISIRGTWFGFKKNIESIKLKMKQTATEWSLEYIVNNYQGQEFSLIIKYAKIAITAPVTNAWPERGTSAVKRTKSQLRSTMKMGLLNALLMILINGPTNNSKEAMLIIQKATERCQSSK